MKKLPISICVVSGAEVHRIGRMLDSVAAWAGEIIIVLNEEVQDGTEELARRYGAEVVREPWKGFIGQKNSVAEKASQPWLLNIDADEIVTAELYLEISEVVFAPNPLHTAYEFPRCSWYCGRWIRHGDWYPDRVCRLWKRGTARWTGQEPHAVLKVSGTTGRLRSDLQHYTNDSVAKHVGKIIPYGDAFVRSESAKGRRPGMLDLAVRPVWKFLRAYFFRLGFLDGWQGYYIAWLNAFSVVTKYARLKEDSAGCEEAMRLTLILSTYNQPAALAKVLQGLSQQTRQPDEFIIADDGSGEPTRKVIDDWQRKSGLTVKHVWHPDDGFRKTVILNQSVAAATGDYLVLTDADCVPHRKFIEDHVALADPGFWVQGRRCFVEEKFVPEFEPGKTSVLPWMLSGRITGGPKGLRLPFPVIRRDKKQRGIIGCNMAFWRDDVVAVNGFDEEYSGWGIGEDSDIGTRLYHLGRPRKFVYGRAIIYHLNHPMLPRGHFPASEARLQETIRSGKIRCERGLDQYLKPKV